MTINSNKLKISIIIAATAAALRRKPMRARSSPGSRPPSLRAPAATGTSIEAAPRPAETNQVFHDPVARKVRSPQTLKVVDSARTSIGASPRCLFDPDERRWSLEILLGPIDGDADRPSLTQAIVTEEAEARDVVGRLAVGHHQCAPEADVESTGLRETGSR